MIARHQHAFRRCHARLAFVPVHIQRSEFARALITLQNDAEVRRVIGHFDRALKQGFVSDHATGFQPARGRNNGLGGAIVDPDGKFMRRKPAKNDRVDRTNPGAGQHGNQRFRHHGHVNDHPIAGGHSACGQCSGQGCHLLLELRIGGFGFRAGDRTVMDNRNLITATAFHMPVDRVPARVDLCVGEPFVKAVAVVEKGLPGGFNPVNRFGLLEPVSLRIGLPAIIFCAISHALVPPPRLVRQRVTPGQGPGARGVSAISDGIPL